MKKAVLFALMFAAVAGAAHAQAMPPLQNRSYVCTYTNPSMGEASPGISIFSFVYLNTTTLKRGIEYYDHATGYRDNRKATFAKPQDRYRRVIGTGEWELWATDWEFTLDADGIQCTTARVTQNGARISFFNCSDGSLRSCS